MASATLGATTPTRMNERRFTSFCRASYHALGGVPGGRVGTLPALGYWSAGTPAAGALVTGSTTWLRTHVAALVIDFCTPLLALQS